MVIVRVISKAPPHRRAFQSIVLLDGLCCAAPIAKQKWESGADPGNQYPVSTIVLPGFILERVYNHPFTSALSKAVSKSVDLKKQ